MKSNLDKSFSLEELAHHIHVSPSRLSALFREKTKYSPIYLFTSFKIQRACQLLRDSGKSVKAIANQLGYEDQYHFSRVFKNIMGISPKFFQRIATLSALQEIEIIPFDKEVDALIDSHTPKS